MAALTPRQSRAILLRGINVGGKVLPMATLRTYLESAGLRDVQTLLQSGNAVARGGPAESRTLERRLERDAERALGWRIDFHVRSARELRAVVHGNPFPAQANDDPAHLIVYFLKDPVDAQRLHVVRSAITGPEICEAVDRHLYVVYPDGMGRSTFTSALVERTLGARGTARNWNTVLKLAALAANIDRT